MSIVALFILVGLGAVALILAQLFAAPAPPRRDTDVNDWNLWV